MAKPKRRVTALLKGFTGKPKIRSLAIADPGIVAQDLRHVKEVGNSGRPTEERLSVPLDSSRPFASFCGPAFRVIALHTPALCDQCCPVAGVHLRKLCRWVSGSKADLHSSTRGVFGQPTIQTAAAHGRSSRTWRARPAAPIQIPGCPWVRGLFTDFDGPARCPQPLAWRLFPASAPADWRSSAATSRV